MPGLGILTILARARLAEQLREENMKNPLDSLWGTVISGFALTAVLYVFVRSFLGHGG